MQTTNVFEDDKKKEIMMISRFHILDSVRWRRSMYISRKENSQKQRKDLDKYCVNERDKIKDKGKIKDKDRADILENHCTLYHVCAKNEIENDQKIVNIRINIQRLARKRTASTETKKNCRQQARDSLRDHDSKYDESDWL